MSRYPNKNNKKNISLGKKKMLTFNKRQKEKQTYSSKLVIKYHHITSFTF